VKRTTVATPPSRPIRIVATTADSLGVQCVVRLVIERRG